VGLQPSSKHFFLENDCVMRAKIDCVANVIEAVMCRSVD
jgi:hypothetical protein